MTQDYIAFEGIIEQHGEINAAFIKFPFSTEELFGKKGQVKIKVLFDGKVEYRGSLAKMKSNFHTWSYTRSKKTTWENFGDEVSVKLWEDKEERMVEIPKMF
jgi:hypothetical protein